MCVTTQNGIQVILSSQGDLNLWRFPDILIKIWCLLCSLVETYWIVDCLCCVIIALPELCCTYIIYVGVVTDILLSTGDGVFRGCPDLVSRYIS